VVTIAVMSSSHREFDFDRNGTTRRHSERVDSGALMLQKLAVINLGAGHVRAREPACTRIGALGRMADFFQTNAVPTLISLLLVALVTLAYFGLRDAGLRSFVPVIYLIPVVVAATRWGIASAIVASLAGFLVSDYFFYPPYYSFVIDNPQQVVNLLLFLFVALVTSNLASHLKREADALRQSQKELHDLYEFSRRLAGCFTVSDLILAIQIYLTRTLARSAFLIGTASDGEVASSDTAPEQIRREAAAMIAAGEQDARTIFDASTRSVWLIRPLTSETADHGVLAVDLGTGTREAVETMRRRIDSVLADAMATLERLDLTHAMDEAKLRQQSDMLKDALIGSVSHELRTPLTSILGSASVLDTTPEIQQHGRVRALVESIYDEAKQLDNDIQNLLDATRITARGVHPRLEWVDPADIVSAAINQRSRRLSKHKLELELDRDLPLVKVESALIEQAFGQFLENAAKYSPTGSTIKISARTEQAHVILSVSDEGVGLTPDETPKLGRRAFRGRRHVGGPPGSGLGLWIANTFVTANGGTIDAISDGTGLGTTMSIRLPAAVDSTPEVMAAADG
jgi:K+-sensing histidine kinase KdpD